MPKKIMILMAVLLCFSLTGCTTMIPLTEDEEEEIAIYTSSLISKYNRNQTNGITYISEQRQLEIAETEASYHPALDEEVDEEPEDTDVIPEDDAMIDETNLDLDDLEGTAGVEAGTGKTAHTTTGDEVAGESISLTDLVGTSGISVSYQGATTAKNYGSDVFDISPTRGYQYLVMTFQLKNTSSQAVSVNMEDLGLVFRATVGGVTAKADQTILIEDFKTYTGTIGAGESQNVVLLFQYPSSGLSDLSNLSLKVDRGGKTYAVVL